MDLLNTIDKRTFRRHGEPHVAGEHLTSPQALADWLTTAHLPTSHGSRLDPGDLAAAIALREALRAALDGDSAALAGYPVRLVPGPPDEGLRLAAGTGRPWLDEIVETVAASVARGDWKRVKLCAAPDCRWAFHDTSRNGRGRWCEMGVCGNRHKTRAYRERRQQHTV
ncbi:putative RNA-binding Zn ribbon-like protein [Paractinoplanes brasiliensis]|uniref:Putative RNA-binding Zn ribbon-like protein n=1 Tax=Paractinoplanes brasiliensis TaxID=52695 RepID=A0A4R6JAD8_9ACTN|nr:putative RNA-binding Zn ribbon-like protein [Actinoplanes brasiliensis]